MTTIQTIRMPDIGEGVVEGEVIRWLKEIGDEVKKDEPIVIIMTDKATVELPTPYAGILIKKYYSTGEIAIKDRPLYDVETKITHVEPSKKEDEKEPSLIKKKIKTNESHNVLATPKTRDLAKKLNIDINTLVGSGKEQRITVEDLSNSISKKVAPAELNKLPGDLIEPFIGIPRKMAEKMALSHKEIVHFSYFESVDATRLVQMKNKFNQKGKEEHIHITFIPFLVKALSIALSKFPKVNSSIDLNNNTLLLHQEHHVGIAMSTELGLIVPVLKSVQKLNLEEIIRRYTQLKLNAKNKKLTSEDMKNATITISNFGVLGNGQWATPVINYPEVAILAISKIQKQPLVKNNQIVIKEMLNLSWSFDHRVIDGDMAASFSHYFASLIENPVQLL